MSKIHGKRYAYKFDFHGLMAACQAQAQNSSELASVSNNMISSNYNKYQSNATQSEYNSQIYATTTGTTTGTTTSATPSVSNYSSSPSSKSGTSPTAASSSSASPSTATMFPSPPFWPYSPPSFDPSSRPNY